MSEGKIKCSECGAVFETRQALGSHIRYKHGKSKKDAPPRGGLDLKNAFIVLLHDVGVRKAARTIAEIYFDTGGDSMENLDRVLRLAGVSNPARNLVLRRWAQRVNKEVGENLLRSENLDQKGSSDIFEAYERMRESDLKELLMEDLRTRIEERRTKKKPEHTGEDILLRMIDKLSDEVRELRLSQTVSRPLASRRMPSQLPSQPTRSYAYRCDDPYHSRLCVVCGSCGFHGSILRIPIGEVFSCPRCGNRYLKDH